MRALILATLVSVALVPRAQATTFDCSKALNFVEKAICSDPKLGSMDDQLSKLYNQALSASSNINALKAGQRSWLSSRNQCKAADCIAKAYADRIGTLSALPVSTKSGDVTGTYEMKEGGAEGSVLVQQMANGKLKFEIAATYRTNTGELSGEVPLTGGTASYVGKDSDCNLSFKFSSGALVLNQDGSCGMGLNVSASGTYKRRSSTPPKFEQ